MTNNRLYDVYEVVDHNDGIDYLYVVQGDEGRSRIKKLAAKSYEIVDGGEGLRLDMAEAKIWEKKNGEELPDLLEE